MSVDGAGEALCTEAWSTPRQSKAQYLIIIDSKINGADASTILFLTVFQGSWQDIDLSGRDASPRLQVHRTENRCQKDVRTTYYQSMWNFIHARTSNCSILNLGCK